MHGLTNSERFLRRGTRRVVGLPLVLAATIVGCGGGDSSATTDDEQAAAPAATSVASDLTADELENGLGPIRSVEITDGVIDAALAGEGEQIFVLKCSACHKMDERYVGPGLGDVTTRRTAAYVMNMILNPAEMVERHPEARKLLAEYYTPMAFQDVTEGDARALLEYLRQVGQTDGSTP